MNKIYGLVLAVMTAALVIMGLKLIKSNNKSQDAIDDLKKSIIASDKLQKEANGQYSKLVDYYYSQKQLSEDLKESNRALYTIISNNNERILSLTKSVISLKEAVSSGQGQIDPIDSSRIHFKLTYPDIKSPFITWDGSINRHTAKYNGNWKFGKMPISIVVTEESRGLWKHRLVGPEWLLVDSLIIKSIPPTQYEPTKETLLNIIGGGVIGKELSTASQFIGIGVGINIKNHNVILNMLSNNQVSLGYYYNFKTIKKK
jgi:hypothetical protein